MKLIKRIILGIMAIIVILFIFILIQYLWKGNPGLIPNNADKEIVAHRGLHLNYRKGTYDPIEGCEAEHIFPPSHDYIDNTIRSIDAAFKFGATIVEIDIRKTADNDLVVFHDFMLECRTDGKGLIAEHDAAYLKKLDIGYGYTADDGKTYPFRGKGIGLMPTLDEVLTKFPDKTFMIDHKDWDGASINILIQLLKKYPEEQRSRIYLWSNPEHLKTVQLNFPEMNALFLSREEVKKYFIPFFISFGLIKIPVEYRGRVMSIPVKYIKYIWGWPYRFINSIHKSELKFYLMADTKEEAEKFKNIPVDGYLTDFIEIIGKELRE